MKPIDAEGMVQAYLAQLGFDCSATPLPPDFAERLPFVYITRTGGQTYHVAADLHMLSFDVYAPTWAQAMDAAGNAVEAVRSMRGLYTGGVQFYVPNVNMPYNNPDPNHADVPRVTFTATLTASGKE